MQNQTYKKFNLVEIKQPEFDVEIDIRYATKNNFTGELVYKKSHHKQAKCFLHVDAAEKLQKAILIAKNLGLRFKIFDAFRPSEAQFKLWAHTPDPDFLADPTKGSPHSRGVAIDLNLIDKNGVELDMGTDFDAFTPLSHHAVVQGISVEAQKNRLILMGIMTASGWDFYRNEWWHYQLFNSKSYTVISDLDAETQMM
jgi:zinc D-Ala-D-Ala dipeptidase